MMKANCVRIVVPALLCCALAACGDDDDRDDLASANNGPGHDAGTASRDGGLPLAKDGGSSDASPRDAAELDANDAARTNFGATDYAACLGYAEGWFDVSPGPDARFDGGPGAFEATPDGPLLSLRWSTEQSGLYAVSAFGEYVTDGVSIAVAAGDCDGPILEAKRNPGGVGSPEVDPIVLGLHATAGTDYVLEVLGRVSKANSQHVRVRVEIELLCPGEDPDDCVAWAEGGRVCGVELRGPAPFTGVEQVVCTERAAPGEVDARCPDSEYGGERVEGCCRPDGVCGQLDPVLGCHLGAQSEWPYWPERLQFFCDERAKPDPPDFYQCVHEDEPCVEDLDCCAHYNYGNASCMEGKCVLPEG